MEGEYGGPVKLDMVRVRLAKEVKIKDRRIEQLTQQQVGIDSKQGRSNNNVFRKGVKLSLRRKQLNWKTKLGSCRIKQESWRVKLESWNAKQESWRVKLESWKTRQGSWR